MAKFVDAPTLRKEETPPLVFDERPKIEDIKLEEKKFEFNYLDEIKKMSEKAKGAEGKPGPGLRVTDVDIDMALTTVDQVKALRPEERHLQQARLLINQKKYREALTELGQVLAINPTHHEAHYLVALCHTGLNREMEALKALYPLRDKDTPLDPRLETRVYTLLGELRTRLQFRLLLQFFIVNRETIARELAGFINLDPDFEFYPFLLAIIYLESGRPQEAHDCVTKALQNPLLKNPQQLGLLKIEIERRLLGELLAGVVRLYRKGAFGKARKDMAGVDVRFRDAREYRLLDAYLQTLSTGIFRKKVPSDVEFQGSAKDREVLQSLIVREDIARSLLYLQRGDLDKAERELGVAKNYAASYPYVNFMLGGLKYRKIPLLFMARKLTDFDAAIAELKEARNLAEIGARDKSSDEPKKLIQGIDDVLTFLNRLKQDVERFKVEVRQVNETIMEFSKIMESAKAGITSLEMLHDVAGCMKALQKRAQAIQPKLTFQDNKKVFAQLMAAIKANMTALETTQRDSAAIQQASQELQSIREYAKSHISTEQGREDIIERLESLQQQVTTDIATVKSEQAKESLKKLKDIIARDIEEVSKIRRKVIEGGDNEILNKDFQFFKTMVDRLNDRKTIKSRQDLQMWAEVSSGFIRMIEEDKSKVFSYEAKDALSKLLERVRDINRQLERNL